MNEARLVNRLVVIPAALRYTGGNTLGADGNALQQALFSGLSGGTAWTFVTPRGRIG